MVNPKKSASSKVLALTMATTLTFSAVPVSALIAATHPSQNTEEELSESLENISFNTANVVTSEENARTGEEYRALSLFYSYNR